MERSVHSQLTPNGLIQLMDAWADAEGPLYRRLSDGLRSAIARGDVIVGQLLPPERLLARHLALSRSTVVAAYQLLQDEGLLERRQGSGTRVRARPALPPQSGGINAALNRNTVFRSMVDGPGTTVNLTGAYLVEPSEMQIGFMREMPTELARLAETSGYAPLGYAPLREAIARHLSARGVPTQPEEVLVTSGAQQAIYLVGWLFLQRGDVTIVENPTYPGALDAFTSLGARLVGIRTRRQGVDLEQLADCLNREVPRMVYLIPTHHNPVGGVLSESSRHVLASLVQKHEVSLVEDDSLSALGSTGDPPRPVAAFSPNGPILTIGSLSKLTWAGLRVGWVRASGPVIARLGRLKAVADLGGSLPGQVIATRMLESYEQVRQERMPVLARRLELATNLLRQMLPGWTWDSPQGGLCLWVRLPRGSATEFAQVALRHGVSIVAGPVASCDGSFGDYLRLPFGHHPDVLEEGVRRLARAWQTYAPVETVRAAELAVIV